MKQKLYIRKPNGRYEEYQEPSPPDTDNALYKRYGKKYVPVEMCLRGEWSWQEGVFAVIRTSKLGFPNRFVSADYLQKIFSLYRCGDIEEVSISELAGMDKLAAHLCKHWSEIQGDSIYEQCASIVAILFNYKNKQL